MRLRSLAFSVATSLVIATTAAQAADLYGSVKDEPREVEYRGFSWTGVYGGIHAGGAWGDATLTENLPNLLGILPPSISSGHDMDGGIAGVHLGANKQFGNIVLGAELRLSGSDISGSNADCFGITTLAGGLATADCNSSVNWVGSAMAKVGYAWDRWMLYGNIGWAVAGVDHRATLSVDPQILPISLSSATNETADGLSYGVGFEFAATENIIFGLEYTRTELQADGSGLLLGGVLTTGSRDIDLDEVKARLSYKFGG
ncbi:MAG: outer membrane protein [Hyphomicrobiaceae bacterium]